MGGVVKVGYWKKVQKELWRKVGEEKWEVERQVGKDL